MSDDDPESDGFLPEPDNVIPMRGHTHECPSCRAQIVTERLYEGHSGACMQPEMRMRRAEARILELVNAVNTQTEVIESAHAVCLKLEELGELRERRIAQLEWCLKSGDWAHLPFPLAKDHHGKPTEDIEPDTKRSGGTTGLGADWAPPVSRDDGLSERSLEALWAGPFPRTPGFTHPDAEPAEPSGEAPAGAEPAPAGSERPR